MSNTALKAISGAVRHYERDHGKLSLQGSGLGSLSKRIFGVLREYLNNERKTTRGAMQKEIVVAQEKRRKELDFNEATDDGCGEMIRAAKGVHP